MNENDSSLAKKGLGVSLTLWKKAQGRRERGIQAGGRGNLTSNFAEEREAACSKRYRAGNEGESKWGIKKKKYKTG